MVGNQLFDPISQVSLSPNYTAQIRLNSTTVITHYVND